jgi:hypothetical protein
VIFVERAKKAQTQDGVHTEINLCLSSGKYVKSIQTKADGPASSGSGPTASADNPVTLE